ncbi:MAG: hypothetical protein ABR600_03050 [Actinomycetota bacterium]
MTAAVPPHVRPTNRWLRSDVLFAGLLAAAAATVYAVTFHPDWIFDPLRYAELTQRGPARVLLGPQHALGNLLPLLAYRAARGMGYGGRAMPVLAACSVAAAAAVVAGVFVACRRLGGSLPAAALAAATLGSTTFLWRAGGSGGVYGMAAATLALGWVAAAHFVRQRGVTAAALLGVAGGIAVGGHLANLAFLAAASLLVFALEPSVTRVRALGAFAGSAALVAAVVFGVTAGFATGWSPSAMRDWALHPGIGGPTDRSSLVGWGIGGFPPAVAEGVTALTIGLLAAAVVRGVMLATRSRIGAILAAALTLNAGIAFLLASWYQALRPDYWGMGLVPLAVMAGAGTRAYGRRTAVLRWIGALAALAAVGVLLAWNAGHEVAPSLELSRARGRAVEAIEARIPPGGRVLISPLLAGRLADDGYVAETGFAALKRAVEGGGPKPGVTALEDEAASGAVWVSSAAFGFTSGQAQFLGATGRDVWRILRQLGVRPVLRTHGLPRDETVYRLRAVAPH